MRLNKNQMSGMFYNFLLYFSVNFTLQKSHGERLLGSWLKKASSSTFLHLQPLLVEY
jgi:hypothetical protein